MNNRKIKKYSILLDPHAPSLSEKVNKEITLGAEPFGSITWTGTQYAQAVVYFEKESREFIPGFD